jgi:hypothetical protein
MPFALEQLTQGLSIAAKIDPQTLAQNTALTSGSGVDMSKFRRAMAVVQIGASNAGSVTCKFQAATASGGTFTPVAGSTTTAVTTSSKVVTLEIRDDELQSLVGAGYQWLRLDVIEGNVGSAGPISAVVLGGEAEYKPAKSNDIAAVTQRLVV